MTLLCTMTGSAWAEDEVLLSYQMDNENYDAKTELAAGNVCISTRTGAERLAVAKKPITLPKE